MSNPLSWLADEKQTEKSSSEERGDESSATIELDPTAQTTASNRSVDEEAQNDALMPPQPIAHHQLFASSGCTTSAPPPAAAAAAAVGHDLLPQATAVARMDDTAARSNNNNISSQQGAPSRMMIQHDLFGTTTSDEEAQQKKMPFIENKQKTSEEASASASASASTSTMALGNESMNNKQDSSSEDEVQLMGVVGPPPPGTSSLPDESMIDQEQEGTTSSCSPTGTDDPLDTAATKKKPAIDHQSDGGDKDYDVVWMGDKNPDQDLQTQDKKSKEAPPPANAKASATATADATGSSPPENSKEWRHRRRRRLRRVFKKSKGNPSFVTLLNANYDVSDDEAFDQEIEQLHQLQHSSRQQPEPQQVFSDPGQQQQQQQQQGNEPQQPLPKRIRIDLDAALGLKGPNAPAIIPINVDEEEDGGLLPTAAQDPTEEGWYEGVAPMALPEDAEYLNPQQQWVRQNLEYFSATAADAAVSSAGRRTRTVRGRVGIRCVHCAQASAKIKQEGGGVARRSTGSVSYPLNIGGIHSMVSQKIALHFEKNCPNLPDDRRMQLARLMQDTGPKQQRSARRSQGGMPNSLYTIVSAKRIGLVDLDDSIRFSRDLSLDPFPFETIRTQVDNEQLGLNSSNASLLGGMDMSAAAALVQPRITADADSERVLAEAIAELADEDANSSSLCRAEDKKIVTDYFFLTLKQMKICNAVASDFSSRGKTSRTLRIGGAGFCCRWCDAGDGKQRGPYNSSCRSFTSAADGLSSAISNSFSSHLQKCPSVPTRIKNALLAYKRIHSRQMAQLPYGSQRRLILELWNRLRAADKTEDEMQEYIQDVEPVFEAPVDVLAGMESKNAASIEYADEEEEDEDDEYERPVSFPVCQDWETQAILNKSLSDWDSSNLLLKRSDRRLISDYVFLTMMQLRIIFPDQSDSLRIRRGSATGGVAGGFAGLGCIHCSNRGHVNVSPSGRAFPSAPDNFASALNTSLFNHMQVCPYTPDDLKRALANLRKIHSAQCSSLQFGSQRRFFNILFARLSEASGVGKSLEAGDDANESETAPTDDFLAKSGFLHIPGGPGSSSSSLTICRHCRMVPIQFRAPNSTFLGQRFASTALIQQHSLQCKKDALDLGMVAQVLNDAIRSNFQNDISLIERESFKAIIRAAVGGHEILSTVFTDGVARRVMLRRANNKSPLDDLNESDSLDDLRNLWNQFPTFVDFSNVENAFRTFAEDVGVSTDVRDHPALLQYLLLISPSLVVPEKDETDAKPIDDSGDVDELVAASSPNNDAEQISGGEAVDPQTVDEVMADV